MSLFSGPSWTQLHQMKHGGKTDLLIELSDFHRIKMLKTAGKSVKRRPTSFGAFFSPIFDSVALLNREEFSSFFSPGGATL